MRPVSVVVCAGLLGAWCGSARALGERFGVDHVVGFASRQAGSSLVKRFTVEPGSTLQGVEFLSNDLETVFPRVAVFRGPITRLEDALELRDLHSQSLTTSRHGVIYFAPLFLQTGGEIFVSFELPLNDGADAVGDGPGLGARSVEAPNGSFIVMQRGGDLQPIAEDLAIRLVVAPPPNANKAAPDKDGGLPRTDRFLRVSSPKVVADVATIEFGIQDGGRVELGVFNVAGRRVRSLVAEDLPAGIYSRSWDGKDTQGVNVANGLYLLRLRANGKSMNQKVAIVR